MYRLFLNKKKLNDCKQKIDEVSRSTEREAYRFLHNILFEDRNFLIVVRKTDIQQKALIHYWPNLYLLDLAIFYYLFYGFILRFSGYYVNKLIVMGHVTKGV